MSAPETAERERAPLGFVVVVTLAVLYLVIRAVQMIGWLVDWLV